MTPQDQDRMLLGRLRSMWERRDPMPEGLVEHVLATLATHGLDEEYEMLTLVDATERLAGVRGAPDSRTLTFSSGTATVMLRVSVLAHDRRRVDGWVTPGAAYDVRLEYGAPGPVTDEVRATATPLGRFELADVAPGTVTLRLTATPDLGTGEGERAAVAPLWLTTPPFTL